MPKIDRFTTRELSTETLPDFESLLETHPAPGAFSCWCLYNHSRGPHPASRGRGAERSARNRREKRELVENDRSHGIVVYAGGEPVGWCQFGPAEELPRIENTPGYRKLAADDGPEKLWRITCFVVAREYRRKGAASTGLRAALKAIKEQGGGLVEAYPILRWGAYSEYRGTRSMFKREGFEVVGHLGQNNVIMRRML